MIDKLDVGQVIDLPIQIVYKNEFQYFNIINHFYILRPNLNKGRKENLENYNDNKISSIQSLILTSDYMLTLSNINIFNADAKIHFKNFETYEKLEYEDLFAKDEGSEFAMIADNFEMLEDKLDKIINLLERIINK